MPKENWFLNKINEGIDHKTEANTSRYVHEVIRYCFDWPFERIVPQASRRGFIDYTLKHEDGTHLHVEVKPIGARLQDRQIIKYLSSRANSFNIGVLTNLLEWQIFTSGRPVKRLTGSSVHRLHQVVISKRGHICELAELIGYRTCSDSVKLFELFSQSEEVLKHFLSRDKVVTMAIRKRLMEVTPDVRTPNNNSVAKLMRRLINKRSLLEIDVFWERPLKNAACSSYVADAIRQQVIKNCNASAGQRRVQASIRRIISPS